MADSERRGAKRSRFDQSEPEPKRASRFDRRSRSPSAAGPADRQRSRSPVNKSSVASPSSSEVKSPRDPAAAAAAAAARINAQIQAKKGIQHVDVPPIRQASSDADKPSSSGGNNEKSGSSTSNINGEVYIADGDYIKDIEVNDLRNRYTLTKGSTQKMIKEETGADVTTRGNYYPDKSMASAAHPPLYLHITSTSKSGLEKAIEKINELMKQELPNLVDERRFRRREPEQFERDELGRRKWPEEKIPIDLEPIQGFNLRAQVVGHGGAYVKHIQQETRCRVQIKGRGSGFTEHGTNQESDEPMYLHVAGPDPKEVQHARELCLSLLENVREQYQRFKDNPPPRSYGNNNNNSGYPSTAAPYGSYGGGGGGGGAGGGHAGSPTQHHNPYASPTTAAPPGTAGASAGGAPGAPPGSSTDYAAQYSQYYGAAAGSANGSGGAAGAATDGQDPYAAYGGYQNYVAYYYAYMQQQQQQQQQQQEGAPPAPPPGSGGETDSAPPPPPPGGNPPGPGGYNSVPPPPGM